MLTFQGSTNGAAPTILDRGGSGNIFYFLANKSAADGNVEYIAVRDMVLRNAGSAIYAVYANAWGKGLYNCLFEDLVITNNSYGFSRNSGWGIEDGNVLRRCILAGNTARTINGDDLHVADYLTVENCTIYATPTDYACFGYFSATNTIFHVSGAGKRIYSMTGNVSDYNVLYTTGGAEIHASFATLATWASPTRDANSIDDDPLFAAPPADFHLQSRWGRYSNGVWVADAEVSPAIDAGATNSPFVNELDYNGVRINCGAYGNTSQASKSPPPATGTVFFFK